jgi:hypothetical protein
MAVSFGNLRNKTLAVAFSFPSTPSSDDAILHLNDRGGTNTNSYVLNPSSVVYTLSGVTTSVATGSLANSTQHAALVYFGDSNTRLEYFSGNTMTNTVYAAPAMPLTSMTECVFGRNYFTDMPATADIAWVAQNNGFNTSLDDSAHKIATDASRNIYITYTTSGVTSGGANTGLADVVVVKLNEFGVQQWSRQFTISTTANDTNPSIATDSAGNVYIAYQSFGTISGGTNTGDFAIVVLKLDTSGATVWIRENSVTNTTAADTTPSLAVDSAGNAYVAYMTAGITSGGTLLGANTDIVVFKLTTLGQIEWVRQTVNMNTTGTESSPNIAVSPAGTDVYVCYTTTAAMSGGSFGGGTRDTVVIRLTSAGAQAWTRQTQLQAFSTADENTPRIVADAGFVYLTYSTAGTVSGGTQAGGAGTFDIAVYKMSSAGALVWIRQSPVVNTAQSDTTPSIGVDSLGNVYVSYLTAGTVSGGVLSGTSDIVLFKLNSSGAVQWVRQTAAMNTTADEVGPELVVDASGNCILGYNTTGTIAGGANTGGSRDVVLVKFVNQRYARMDIHTVAVYDGDLTADRMAPALVNRLLTATNSYNGGTGIYTFGVTPGFRSVAATLSGTPAYTTNTITLDGNLQSAVYQSMGVVQLRQNTVRVL